MPTEAEWEYACRAGGKHSYCGSDNYDSVAWYGDNSGGKTHATAGKQANAWGLYDMSGNVHEWLEDCWNANYKGAPSDGSAWTKGDCKRRVFRGGSWEDKGRYLTWASWRGGSSLVNRSRSIGFRLARTLF